MSPTLRATLALMLGVGFAAPSARAQTVPDAAPLYDRSDWILLGGLLAAELMMFPLDDDVRELAVDGRGAASDDVAAVLRPLGRTQELAAAGIATYALGMVISERRVADFGLHAFIALALSNAVTGGLKAVTGRARPITLQADGTWARRDPDDWDLFGGWGSGGERTAYASGHTSNAFAIATVFAEELGGAAGWVAYPIAAGVAWSRVNDEAHWASDVVMGALVGIASGQLVVRHGHRRDGWLERMLLVDPSASLDRVDLGVQIPAP
jgi:membrane-associated phospholipid phosphatase